MSGVSKWYDLRPFSDIVIDIFSLYSVINASIAACSTAAGFALHENSKIALPAKGSATAKYRLSECINIVADYL